LAKRTTESFHQFSPNSQPSKASNEVTGTVAQWLFAISAASMVFAVEANYMMNRLSRPQRQRQTACQPRRTCGVFGAAVGKLQSRLGRVASLEKQLARAVRVRPASES